jgi:hypothetical protein
VFWQTALIAGQMWLGEVTRPRPRRIGFDEFKQTNGPSEVRPLEYAGGTIELIPPRIWYGDFTQRAVERDSHWTDFIWAAPLQFLLDVITVGYRYYCGEAFSLCYGPDAHVERVTIGERLMYQAAIGTDNAGGGFLIDDPEAWGGDQPPGEGGQYSWCDITRGNFTDPTNAYLESLLSTPPNRTPSLRGVSCLISRGRLTDASPAGFTESGYFAAGGVGFIPRFREWKVVIRRQPDNLQTGFHQVRGPGKSARRHMNPAETIYEWATSLEYGAQIPLDELNVTSLQAAAETFYNEDNGWSGKIAVAGVQPLEVVNNICAQVDAIMDPSPSLGLTIRLIRRDYSFGSLRVLTQDKVNTVTNFSPGTYDDTVNKVEVPCFDMDNNFVERKGLYADPANQLIQDGRTVPQTQDYRGVGDLPTANALATRDGQALSVPRAVMTCDVMPTFGRLTYRGEALILEWESPSFSKVMRVLDITPGSPERGDYQLVMIEDQFATGFRVSGDAVGTGHDDPAAGLDTAPPSAIWNEAEFPPDGLTFTLQLTNTNQFQATITGGITFGTYAPGGQYARIYVTEPLGVQTLSPIYLSPDDANKATFTWPALAAGTYEFCVQTFSLRQATNGVKVCAEIVVAELGSPSASPSSSVSPSVSPSLSPSASVSASPSPSASASASVSPSSSESPSTSASVSPSSSASPSVSSSPSASVSPSGSVSPSASASPSGPPPSDSEIVVTGNAEIEAASSNIFGGGAALASGVTDAHGRVYDNATFQTTFDYPVGDQEFVSAGCRFRFRTDATDQIFRFVTDPASAQRSQMAIRRVIGGTLRVNSPGPNVNYDSGSANIATLTWYYAMLYTRLHDTAGEFIAKLFDASGALIETLTQTNIDTYNTGSPARKAEATYWGGATGDTYIDHLWTDVTGAFRGCGYVETLSPTSNGDTNSWSRGGTDTGNNWDQVDEVPKNQTSYVVSTGADQVELYGFANRAQAGTPIAVHQIIYAHAHTAGTREYKPICKIGGVVYEGATQTTTDTSNLASPVLVAWQNNPATSGAWTDSDIDGAQFGAKSVTTDVRIQNMQLHVLVDIES